MKLKDKLVELGDKVELMFRSMEAISNSDSIPNISGWFIIDSILKTLCGFVHTGGFIVITLALMLIAFIMTLTMLFGVTYGWWTLLILIFAIVPYLFLTFLITLLHEYFNKSYEEYKLKKSEEYTQYKQNKNN